LYFKRDGLTLLLRKQDLETTVRNPINASEARKLLKHLRTWKGTVNSRWKARATAHQQTMERGDPFGYAEVYKGLCKLEEAGSLRASDRAHLNQSLNFLVEEISNALGKAPEQVRKQIASAGMN
jgi:RNA polymerase-interacting CarD/CdnL/TRCF family regulator